MINYLLVPHKPNMSLTNNPYMDLMWRIIMMSCVLLIHLNGKILNPKQGCSSWHIGSIDWRVQIDLSHCRRGAMRTSRTPLKNRERFHTRYNTQNQNIGDDLGLHSPCRSKPSPLPWHVQTREMSTAAHVPHIPPSGLAAQRVLHQHWCLGDDYGQQNKKKERERKKKIKHTRCLCAQVCAQEGIYPTCNWSETQGLNPSVPHNTSLCPEPFNI